MPDTIRQCPEGLTHLTQLSGMWTAFDLQSVAEDIYEATHEQMHQAGSHIPFRDRCANVPEPEPAGAQMRAVRALDDGHEVPEQSSRATL